MTQTNPAYLLLKTAVAPKLGQRSEGGITYAILAGTDRQHLFITITANAGGGQFGRDVVPLSAVVRCLPTNRALPFAGKAFAPSFSSRSSNNPGFMAAILRAEGLLGPVPDKAHLHLVAGDWEAWKAAMLAQPGEPYVPVTKLSGAKTPVEIPAAAPLEATTDAAPAMTQNEPPVAPDADQGARRKGRKPRAGKPADEDEHAPAA